MEDIVIFFEGKCVVYLCVRKEVTIDKILEYLNARQSNNKPWYYSSDEDAKFPYRDKNPSECGLGPGRLHYIFRRRDCKEIISFPEY